MGDEDDDLWRQAKARRDAERRAAAEAARPQRVEKVVAHTGGDPVLRIALIRAGLIRADDLVLIEEELQSARASGGIVVASNGRGGNEATSPHTDAGSDVSLGPRSGESDSAAGDRVGP